MALNELLLLGERLIQTNATPDAARRYFDLKNQILFGSLAEPISRYQRENYEMNRTLATLQQEQPQNLTSWVRFELVRMFSPFGQVSLAGDDFCSWAATIVQKAETQTRVEIERCKSNRTKVSRKIQALQAAEPIESANPGAEVQEKRETVQKLRSQLAQRRKQLQQTQSSNRRLAGAVRDLRERSKTLSATLRVMSDKKTEMDEKRNELVEMKAKLTADVKKATENTHNAKVFQRFGTSARLSSNRPKIDLIAGLKTEVEALRKEKEQLDRKKKTIIIETVRNSYRNSLWQDTRLDM
jgi:DNA repair exonuclease SbcCD ATPase subunit